MKKIFLSFSVYCSLLCVGIAHAAQEYPVILYFSDKAQQHIASDHIITVMSRDDKGFLHLSEWQDKTQQLDLKVGSHIDELKVYINKIPVENRWYKVLYMGPIEIDWNENQGFFYAS